MTCKCPCTCKPEPPGFQGDGFYWVRFHTGTVDLGRVVGDQVWCTAVQPKRGLRDVAELRRIDPPFEEPQPCSPSSKENVWDLVAKARAAAKSAFDENQPCSSSKGNIWACYNVSCASLGGGWYEAKLGGHTRRGKSPEEAIGDVMRAAMCGPDGDPEAPNWSYVGKVEVWCGTTPVDAYCRADGDSTWAKVVFRGRAYSRGGATFREALAQTLDAIRKEVECR